MNLAGSEPDGSGGFNHDMDFMALAAACVIYYVVIVIYSGFTTSFSFI